jgi:cytochrome P450
VVRVSPNELAFNSVKAWKDVYGHQPGQPGMLLDPIQVGAVNAIPGVTALTMGDDASHARQRRGLAHAFSMMALMEQEPLIRVSINRLVTCLRKPGEAGSSIDLVEWLNFTTFDIFGDLCFGEPFGCLERGNISGGSQCVLGAAWP